MRTVKPIKILFVCLGNICRSPMAEGIFKDVVQKEDLEKHFIIDSAGTGDYHIGNNPDSRAIATCFAKGISLDHKAQQFVQEHLSEWDYVIAMDHKNRAGIQILSQKVSGTIVSSIYLMRDFDLQQKGADVPDPYYGGEKGFYEVFDMLERSSYELLRYIRKEHSI